MSPKTGIREHHTRRFGNIPLRLVLVLPFMLQILVAVGLVSYISYRNGERAVNIVATRWRTELSNRIEQKLTDFLETPHRINQISADAVRRGSLKTQNLASEQYLWRQIQIFDAVTWIYYGSQPQGAFVGVHHLPDEPIQAVIHDPSNNFQSSYYRLDDQGNRAERQKFMPNTYDARQRPWYQDAVKAGKAVWSHEIYATFNLPELILSAGLPVYDDAGQLLGVCGVDYSLEAISHFLDQLQIGQTGQAFIVERSSGLLVATSTPEKLYQLHPDDQTIQRLRATNSRTSLIQATARALPQQPADLNSFKRPTQWEFSLKGQRQFVQVLPFADQRGLDWLIVVVAPESEFMPQIEANTRNTILFSLVAGMIAILSGLITSRRIAQSIRNISHASEAIAAGDLDQTIQRGHIWELNRLTDSFNQMADKLRQSFDDLETRVEARTTALRESEAKFTHVFQSSPSPISISRPADGCFVEVNESALEFTGYNREEMIGRTSTDLKLWVNPEQRQLMIQTLTDRGKLRGLECQLRIKSGDIRTVMFSGELIDLDGETLLISTINDISDYRQAEAALRQADKKYRSIFEHSVDGIFQTTLAGQYLTANPALARMYGYDSSEALIQDLSDPQHQLYVDPNRRDEFIAALAQTDAIANFESQVYRRDGSIIWISESARVVRDAQGHPLYFEGMVDNITEMKQSEAALQQAKAAAETANRAKSKFLSNMSHELRTPLNAILGFTQILYRDPSLAGQQQEYLGIIHRSGEHLLGLINDVLDMAKIEAGQTTLMPTSFNLHHMLNDLQEMLNLRAQEQGVQLLVQRTANVPDVIKTDQRKLRQVLLNLLGNAIKFTHEGVVVLRVSSAEEEQGSEGDRESYPVQSTPSHDKHPLSEFDQGYPLQFEIEDTGVGIAPEGLDTIFDAFVQTDSGRNAPQGTGLGLAISRQFVQLMGGDIQVKSELGHGTIFTVTLTAEPGEDDAVDAEPSHGQVIGLAPGQRSHRILVVEDRDENRLLLQTILEGVGFEVRSAINGQEGIEVYESWHPDLIWMDMQMPVMNGYEATRAIKATSQGQATVIIALTASVLDEERTVILSVGCDDFVRKPFRQEIIFAKLSEHLGVEYQYAIAPELPVTQTDLSPERLTRNDLAVMSSEWFRQLHQAAIEVNNHKLDQLIQQIPVEHHDLARALSDLVRNFRCDKILALTEGTHD